MLKKIILFLGFTLLLLPIKHSSYIAHAALDKIVVIKPTVYVRETANINASIIDEIQAGDIYDALEKEGDWIKIKLNDKKSGWVANWVVTGYEEANLSSQSGIVTTDGLRVRNGPGTEFEVLGTLPIGEVFQIKEQKNGWVSLSYHGNSGWVSSQFIFQKNQSPDSKHTQVRITASALNVRAADTPDSSIIGTVKKGEAFSVLDAKNNLYKIKLSSKKEGWIPSWYTNSDVEEEGKAEKEEALKGKTIILDAGHGGTDGGATGQAGALEKKLTLHSVNLAYEKLKMVGANVMLTRTNDRYVTLSARANQSNLHLADAFISFHYDSNEDGTMSGIKTYYYHSYQRKLAVTVHNHLLKNDISMNDQGVKQNSFRVLQENLQPAILLELGYINNPADEVYIQTERYQEAITDGLVNGLAAYFKE